MTMNGRRFTTRGDAGQALLHHVAEAHQGTQLGRDTNTVIGAVGGFDVHLEATRHADDIILSLDGIPAAKTYVTVTDLGSDNAGYNVVRRLEGHLNRIDTVLDQRQNSEREHRALAGQTSRLLGTPFERTDELAAAKQRLATVEKELAELDRPPSTPAEEHTDRNPRPRRPMGSGSRRSMAVAQVAARPRDAVRPRAPDIPGRDL
jgi:hypothetical protein